MLVCFFIALVLVLFAICFEVVDQRFELYSDATVVCVVGAVLSLFRGDFLAPTPVGLLMTLAASGLNLWSLKGPYPDSWFRKVEVADFLESHRFGYIGDARAQNRLGFLTEIRVVCDKDLRPWTAVKIVGVRFTRGFRFYYKVKPR